MTVATRAGADAAGDASADAIAGAADWRELDTASRKILWALARERHLPLAALARAVSLPEAHVLLHLRTIVQPWAARHLGQGIVSFRERQSDPLSGAIVTFEWWFGGDPAALSGAGGCELTVESDALVFVATVPTAIRLATAATAEVQNGILRVRIPRIDATDTTEASGGTR